jgi:hypothetical protein
MNDAPEIAQGQEQEEGQEQELNGNGKRLGAQASRLLSVRSTRILLPLVGIESWKRCSLFALCKRDACAPRLRSRSPYFRVGAG